MTGKLVSCGMLWVRILEPVDQLFQVSDDFVPWILLEQVLGVASLLIWELWLVWA